MDILYILFSRLFIIELNFILITLIVRRITRITQKSFLLFHTLIQYLKDSHNKRLISEIVHIKKQKNEINRQNDTESLPKAYILALYNTFSFFSLISFFLFSSSFFAVFCSLLVFSFSILRYSILWKSVVRYSCKFA